MIAYSFSYWFVKQWIYNVSPFDYILYVFISIYLIMLTNSLNPPELFTFFLICMIKYTSPLDHVTAAGLPQVFFPLLIASPCFLISCTCSLSANLHSSQLPVCHQYFTSPPSSTCATPADQPHQQLVCQSAPVFNFWTLTNSVPDNLPCDVRPSSVCLLLYSP